MKLRKTRISVLAGLFGAMSLLLPGLGYAAIISQVWVGTWDSVGSGNPVGSGGPGMVAGQKYVIKVAYDDTSSTTAGVPVLDGFFAPSGNTMTTIKLDDPGNSLDIFVPMEGLDSGAPYIYNQNEGDHFPAFFPNPTLNFEDGSPILVPGNIIGLEYEGDFFPGAGNNIIELFNTSPGAPSPTNMVAQILNFGTGPAATSTNGLTEAVAVVASDTVVTYSAADLVKTTSLAVQSNDLGAGRSDGETFLGSTWSVAGTTQPNGVDIEVAIADSGLTNTVSNTAWSVSVEEAMTDFGDTAQAVVGYSNASPTAGLSASANATGYDFALSFNDLDLAVNALIAGFEMLTSTAMVDGLATIFFDMLLASNSQAVTHAQLEAAFGLGAHQLLVNVEDLAGAVGAVSINFIVDDTGMPVPVAPTFLLVLLGLGILRAGEKPPRDKL